MYHVTNDTDRRPAPTIQAATDVFIDMIHSDPSSKPYIESDDGFDLTSWDDGHLIIQVHNVDDLEYDHLDALRKWLS